MQTTTTSQPKKRSSPKKSLTKNAEITKKLLNNEWWPFDRVNGNLLERLHKGTLQQHTEDALL